MAKLGDGLKFKYEPIWEQAPTDMKFHYWEVQEDGTRLLKIHNEGFKLIKDIEELKEFARNCEGKMVGFDTETTGLTYITDKIVGFSLSLDDMSGIYVPIRHQEKLEIKTEVPKLDKKGNPRISKAGVPLMETKISYEIKESDANLNPKEALNVLYDILIKSSRVLIHNAEFDLNMIKFEGYNVRKIKFFDTLILPYLFDPEATNLARLKALEKRILGRTVPEFNDVLGKKENFALTAPEDGYLYACYDDKTDVLTENGWVKWSEYNGIDKLATVNMGNELLEYQAPTKIYKYKYNGIMECCKSQSIDYCVTPNHNMVVAKSQDPKKGWLLKRADELNVEETAMTAPTKYDGEDQYITVGGKKTNLDDVVEITALILADGYCRPDRTGCVCCATSYLKNYEELLGVINRSPFNWKSWKKSSSDKTLDWQFYDKDFWNWLMPYASMGSINKRVPKELFKAKKETILKFLNIYSKTDGHNYPTGATQYYTTSEGMVNDLQRLLILVGKRSSVWKRAPKDSCIDGRVIKAENCHDLFFIKTTSDKTTRYKKGNRFRKDYSGYVYCAEVPNHTLITRRNGSTLVAGNCYDSSALIALYNKMYPVVRQLLKRFKNPPVFNGVPYDVMSKDNQMVMMFVDYYGHAKILVDRQKAIKYREQLEAEREKVVAEIYDYFDKGLFNLSASSKEFKEVMASKNVYTGVLTEKNAPSWSKKAAAEMKRNLNRLKECLKNWRKYNFVDGKLDKKGIGFQLAQILTTYGVYKFKMKSTINNVSFKGKNGEPMDTRLFWLTVKAVYEEESEKLRILGLIHKNNSLNKALNSYVDKLTQVDECFMKYRLKGTKSGRLSSGNGSKSDKRKNHYYIDLNAQNLTKPASAYYSAEKCDIDDPDGILGWKFKPLDKDYAMEHLEDLYIVEGQDPKITIRGCLKAPKGRYVVSLDYDAEEYKTIAILSGDETMLSNFHNGIDPHTASAYAIWGEENYDKAKRKKAKIFNFLNNYGGGAFTLAQQLDIPETEAQSMIDSYNNTFHEMVDWKQQQVDKMYQNDGIVFTAFGRPRQFKGWINVLNKNSENYETLIEKAALEKASFRVKSAIERRVASHLVQGACGDILRLIMFRLYMKYFRKRDPHVDFLSTVHDEINYTIDKEVTVEYVRDLEELMTFDTFDKTLPITTSTDIGYTYGNMFPFVWEDETTKEVLIPKRVHHA